MAGGVFALNRVGTRVQPLAVLAAALVLALTLGTLLVVVVRGQGFGALAAADWRAVRFTVLQAMVSASLSVLIAVPVARALARRRFAGRGVLIALLGAPFILPVVTAVLGLLAVFGRSGVVNDVLARAGLPPVDIYGPQGVILGHVFFNLPLAVRLILQGWAAIPAERFRLAASLGFSAGDVARHLGRPMLRAVVPGVALVIFLICLTSFAVALTLGGGPSATTVELAIYQAFRFDYDLGRAALLATIQFGLCAAAALLAGAVSVPVAAGGGFDRPVERFDAAGAGHRLLDGGVLAVASLFLLLPIAMVIAAGVPAMAQLSDAVWAAAARSVAVAVASAALAVALGLTLAMGALGWRGYEIAGMLPLAASPLVVGTGLFLIILPLQNPAALALPITAVINAAVALPFVLRAVLPELRAADAAYGPLAASLGITGSARLRLVILPRLRRPLGFSAGLAAALSMGDLGVVALFADAARATLPLHVFALMAAYRIDEAQAAAVVLLGFSFAMFAACDVWGRRDAAA